MLAWPASDSLNPTITELYLEMARSDPNVSVEPFDVARSWRHHADIVHVHWPEMCVESPSRLRAASKTIAVLSTLAIHKVRGAHLVWTVHNLRSHDSHHPLLERALRRGFDRLVDGMIHLTDDGAALADSAFPHLAGTPSTVIGLAHYGSLAVHATGRDEARAQLGLRESGLVLGFVGNIRPYKNVPALIAAFTEMNQPAQLIVAGQARDASLRRDIEIAAARADDVHLELRWLSDEELATRVCATDVVVLPYRDIHNSGAAILALSLGRPVVVPATGSMTSLAAMAGPEWVRLLPDGISGNELDAIAEWAGEERSGSPDLGDLDPSGVALRTLRFYDSLLD